ncbi:PIG-X [Gongronella butleri]|nr:PIG-X [Gongronella butleri]
MSVAYESFLELEDSLHPHLVTRVLTSLSSSSFASESLPSGCTWDLVFRLPPSVFADQYQLQDTLGAHYSVYVHGFQNLELPLEHVPPQDTFVVLRPRQQAVAGASDTPNDHDDTTTTTTTTIIDLPLHLRYQKPDHQLKHRAIQVPRPQWLSVCPEDDEKMRFPPLAASLARINHETSHDAGATLKLRVPVGDLNDQPLVRAGTTAAILLVTLWILWALVRAIRKHQRIEAKGKRRKSE